MLKGLENSCLGVWVAHGEGLYGLARRRKMAAHLRVWMLFEEFSISCFRTVRIREQRRGKIR